jgi:hypothetical protein
MKVFSFSRSLLLVLFLLFSCASAWAQSGDTAPLTNASIVKLVKAGFKEKSIITIIAAKPVSFDLSTDRLIELKRTGVSEKVILAMMARQEGNDFSDETWSDEEFFNQSTKEAKGSSTGSSTKPDNPNDGGTNIFGSSGGSRGATKSRVGNSSGSGDTITTGSATVKILRPPTEADGPAKLEKTKSLTNDSVCELVEAGFSEGTIIRRIEQSPVEFDLSAAKIEELRKRRVSEKIISAMKAAMGGESTK